MAQTTERIEGEKLDRVVEQAADTPQFEAFRSLFDEEYGYEVVEAGAIKVEQEGETGDLLQKTRDKTSYLVTFTFDGENDLRPQVNITLSEGNVKSCRGTIEHLEGDMIEEVEVFKYEDGSVYLSN